MTNREAVKMILDKMLEEPSLGSWVELLEQLARKNGYPLWSSVVECKRQEMIGDVMRLLEEHVVKQWALDDGLTHQVREDIHFWLNARRPS